jgi:hypothetical protein
MAEAVLCQQLRLTLEALAVATEELSKAHQQLQHDRGFTDGLATSADRLTIWCCERHHIAVLHHWQSLTCCASGRQEPRWCCHWAKLGGPVAGELDGL